MKYVLIKMTPRKDDKDSITDFSELDMDLTNNERNTQKNTKKWWRWGWGGERERGRKCQLLKYMLEG